MNNSIIEQELRQVHKVGLQLIDCQLTLHVTRGYTQGMAAKCTDSLGMFQISQGKSG
ncbi:hypothetical protein [Nostoc sp.]|uniref:hypothetical protein n=1 Tax=Nostoc sp. TaxID=1180 RepID=UPI002FF77B2E